MHDVALPVLRIEELSHDAEFLRAVGELYDALDQRTAARNPVCINRGDCCKFTAFGHRLFVTPVEAAYFLAHTDFPPPEPINADACPYQREGMCTARTARPTGCRVFFCDPAAGRWQPDETERTLSRLKALHTEFDIPYAYVEWTAALRAMAAGARSSDGDVDSGAVNS